MQSHTQVFLMLRYIQCVQIILISRLSKSKHVEIDLNMYDAVYSVPYIDIGHHRRVIFNKVCLISPQAQIDQLHHTLLLNLTLWQQNLTLLASPMTGAPY